MCFKLNIFSFILFIAVTVVCRGGDVDVKYVGCYPVILNSSIKFMGNSLDKEFPDACFKFCAGLKNYQFAGLNSVHKSCYCPSNNFQNVFSNINEEHEHICDKTCDGDPPMNCGGDQPIAVYEIKKELTVLMSVKKGVSMLSSYPLNTSRPHTIKKLLNLTSSPDAIDFHLHRREGFALIHGEYHRFSLDGAQSPKTYDNFGYFSALAVDWVHDRVILHGQSYRNHYLQISSVDFDGKSEVTLARLPYSHDESQEMVVDPYKGQIFWISFQSVWTCGMDGRDLKEIFKVSGNDTINNLAVDIYSEKLYFTGNISSKTKLFHTNYNGSESFSRIITEVGVVAGISIVRSRVYIVHRADNKTNISYLDSSFRHHKIDTIEDDVHRMKVLDTDLQSPPTVDSCTHRNCSFHCIVESNDSARCRCPAGYSLEPDSISCKKRKLGGSMFYRVMTGALLVTFIVLSAGVLMCICDNVWSKLRPTVVRISNPGATAASHQRSSGFQRTQNEEDYMNLVND